jgi:hypothetical protein
MTTDAALSDWDFDRDDEGGDCGVSGDTTARRG